MRPVRIAISWVRAGTVKERRSQQRSSTETAGWKYRDISGEKTGRAAQHSVASHGASALACFVLIDGNDFCRLIVHRRNLCVDSELVPLAADQEH